MHPNEILSGALAFLDAVPGGTFNYEMLRACKYRDGLIVALFAARPIRLANMTEMTIGRQLLADNDRWLCRFTADEMKDDRPLAFFIPDTLCPYLETYLNVSRPLLLKCNRHDRLWISTRSAPMREQAIYWNTCQLTDELFGRPINPHLFRDCAASAIASDDPEQHPGQRPDPRSRIAQHHRALLQPVSNDCRYRCLSRDTGRYPSWRMTIMRAAVYARFSSEQSAGCFYR